MQDINGVHLNMTLSLTVQSYTIMQQVYKDHMVSRLVDSFMVVFFLTFKDKVSPNSIPKHICVYHQPW